MSIHKYQHPMRNIPEERSPKAPTWSHSALSCLQDLFHHTVHNEAFCVTGHAASHMMNSEQSNPKDVQRSGRYKI